MMKEKELVNILMTTNLINLCFKNESILNMTNEYTLSMNCVYKSLDIFVNCKECVLLIECKQQLKAHDIGQILTYNLMYDQKHNKPVKLVLAYTECRKDELNLIRSYINKYDLGITLIHLYGDEDNYKYNCLHHKTKTTIDYLNELDKSEIMSYINFKDLFRYKYENIVITISLLILINFKISIILSMLNNVFSKYLLYSLYIAPLGLIYPLIIIIKSFILGFNHYRKEFKNYENK